MHVWRMAGGSDDVLRFGRLSKSTMTTLGCSAAMPHIFTRSSLGSLEKGWKAFGSARVGVLKDKISGLRSSGLVRAYLARGFFFFLNLLEETQLGAGGDGDTFVFYDQYSSFAFVLLGPWLSRISSL
jgi:hypothetical protein